MNNDPLLVGVDSVFPNQNSSTVPTVWEEDTNQAAQQGLVCVPGTMLTLTKRSSNLPLLPDGSFNPCREPNPVCFVAENVRMGPGGPRRLSAGFLGLNLVGVEGESLLGFGVHGRSDNQAVVADGGRFGVVGRGTATAVDGRGVGARTFGVVGVGGIAGVWGGNSASGGIGVVGVSGPSVISGGATVTPWAGRFDGSVQVSGNLSVDGDLFVSGSKAAVVPHPDGSRRATYAVEAPESWLEDVGRAQLRQGVARVDVDPDFAAVAGLGDDYHVFLTPEGPSNGLYVTNRSSSGFEVREQGEGTAELSFSYRIMTRRTDVRLGRLQPVEPPTDEGEKADTRVADVPVSPAPEVPEELPTQPENRSDG